MSTTQDFIDRITKDQLYAFKAGERFNHTVIQEVIERIKPLDLFRSSLASAGFFGNTLLSYTMGKALHSIVKANNNEPLGIGDAQALFSYAMVYTKCLEDATFKASLGEIVPKLGKPNAHLMLGVECSITNGLIHVTIPNQDIIINKDFTLTKHNQGHEALPAAAAADPEDEDFGLAIALSLSHEEQAKHYSSAPTDAAAAAADPEDEDFGLAIALSLSDQKPAQSSGMKALLLKIARLFPEYPQVKEIAAMITKEQLLQLMGDKAVLLREIVQELYNMTDLAQAQALSLGLDVSLRDTGIYEGPKRDLLTKIILNTCLHNEPTLKAMSYQALLETLKVTRFFTEDDLTTALQELTVPDAADPVVVLGDDMGQT